jgi:hypothetical protein
MTAKRPGENVKHFSMNLPVCDRTEWKREESSIPNSRKSHAWLKACCNGDDKRYSCDQVVWKCLDRAGTSGRCDVVPAKDAPPSNPQNANPVGLCERGLPGRRHGFHRQTNRAEEMKPSSRIVPLRRQASSERLVFLGPKVWGALRILARLAKPRDPSAFCANRLKKAA